MLCSEVYAPAVTLTAFLNQNVFNQPDTNTDLQSQHTVTDALPQPQVFKSVKYIPPLHKCTCHAHLTHLHISHLHLAKKG